MPLGLRYTPGWLSCDENYLLVPDLYAPALHVYTWDGEPVKKFDRVFLGVTRGDLAWDISPVNNGIAIIHFEKFEPTKGHFFHAYRLGLDELKTQ